MHSNSQDGLNEAYFPLLQVPWPKHTFLWIKTPKHSVARCTGISSFSPQNLHLSVADTPIPKGCFLRWQPISCSFKVSKKGSGVIHPWEVFSFGFSFFRNFYFGNSLLNAQRSPKKISHFNSREEVLLYFILKIASWNSALEFPLTTKWQVE